jgi:pyridoxal phosphate enzyme (YggS family)
MTSACQAAGRSEADVRLVAVSKLQPAAAVAAALDLGLCDFGENYAQELRDKDAELARATSADSPRPKPRWHFIGPLQRNKVNLVVGRATLIHSVDNLALVTALGERVLRLQQQATTKAQADQVQDCLVQVNVGGEEQKSGCHPKALAAILDAIAAQDGRLRCRGLMCIPPPVSDGDVESVRPYFASLRRLRDEHARVARPHVPLTELSMGMSQDYAVAIAEGATLIRVGTALFGAR